MKGVCKPNSQKPFTGVIVILVSNFFQDTLILAKVEPTGLGGSMSICFAGNSCKLRTVNFQGSALVEGSKRTMIVGMSLDVAFVTTLGHGFAKFDKNTESIP